MTNPEQGSLRMPCALVDDTRVATAKAREPGANVVNDVTEVPGMGWLSIFVDATDAMLGMWQAKMERYAPPHARRLQPARGCRGHLRSVAQCGAPPPVDPW